MKSIPSLLLIILFFPLHAQLSRSDIKLPSFSDSISWSDEKKEKITEYVAGQLTKTLVIHHNGVRVYEYGNTKQPYHIFSARKSILSLLYGIYIDEGTINPNATMDEIGINDINGLSSSELQARIIDLLRARSGVYHKAAFETPGMVKNRPDRGAYARDEYWYYNNWDFNALTTIFEKLTGQSVFQAFEEHISQPLNMEFNVNLQKYHYEEISKHPATLWYFNAEALLLLGQLLLSEGSLNNTNIIPDDWIEESTSPYSNAGIIGGYGYCWWAVQDGFHYPFVNVPEGTFSARGTGEQNLIIIPEWDMVIVHLTEVNSPEDPMMHVTDFGKLLKIIFEQSWF